jgi:hypothetical protein
MHTDEDLRSMARHVYYELDEFRKSAAAIAARKRDENWNRTLESALLHFRNLRGFFVDLPQADDASAQDYVPSWTFSTRSKITYLWKGIRQPRKQKEPPSYDRRTAPVFGKDGSQESCQLRSA